MLFFFQVVAKSLLRVMQMHCQFFLTTSEVFAQFARVNSLEDLTNERAPSEATKDDDNMTNTSQPTPADQQVNKSTEQAEMSSPNKNQELKSTQNVDSPSGLRKHISSFFSKLGGGKSCPGSSETAHSSFYVQTPQAETDAEPDSSKAETDDAVDEEQHETSSAVAEESAESREDVVAAGAGPLDTGATEVQLSDTVDNTICNDSGEQNASQTGTVVFFFIFRSIAFVCPLQTFDPLGKCICRLACVQRIDRENHRFIPAKPPHNEMQKYVRIISDQENQHSHHCGVKTFAPVAMQTMDPIRSLFRHKNKL